MYCTFYYVVYSNLLKFQQSTKYHAWRPCCNYDATELDNDDDSNHYNNIKQTLITLKILIILINITSSPSSS